MLSKVQLEALNRARGKRGFAYFMEMGLGKTLTALADLAHNAVDHPSTRSVVLCPNSFKTGWVDEVEKWGMNVTPHVFTSGADSVNRAFVNRGHNGIPMLIVNYEAIRSTDTQEMIRDFIKGKPSMIIADESVQIKTYDSAQTKAALSLSKDFTWRRILSGKPMVQGPHDLWAQARFIGEFDGINYFAFRARHCKMGGFKGKQVVGARDPEQLARIIEPWSFKAEKKDWSDLPPKVYTTREYSLTPELNHHFNTMLHDFMVWLEDDMVTVDIAISKYIKLSQIQCGFVIDESGKATQLVSDEANPRLNLLRKVVDEEVSGKVVIPYHHRHSGSMLRRALAHMNPAVIAGAEYMGEAGIDVQSEKNRFNNDPNCRVILVQTRAGKYGHTLLGGPEPANRCQTTVFFENTYSLDDRSQVEDRNHRTGQTADSVTYVDLVGTQIDKSMVKALQRKEDVYQSIMQYVSKTRR